MDMQERVAVGGEPERFAKVISQNIAGVHRSKFLGCHGFGPQRA